MMRKIKEKLPVVFFILLAVLFIPGIANAKTKEYQGDLWNFKKTLTETSGAFTYYAYPSKNQKEAWIYKIDMNSGEDCSELSIPSRLDNKKVTRLGSREIREQDYDELYDIFDGQTEPWYSDNYPAGAKSTKDRIKKLVIPDTVKIIQPVSFCNLNSIKTVKIPKSVKTLGELTFYHCDNLKKVELPAGLESLDVMAFWQCPKLTEVKVPKKSKTYQRKGKYVITKKKKELIYAPPSEKMFKIPKGVKILKSLAFSNCISATVHIPASVEKIEENAFRNAYGGGGCVKNVTVDTKNRVYAKDGQCIYNKKDKSLSVAIPDKKGNLYISEKVEKLTDVRNVAGEKSVLKVVYPKTLKTVVDYGFINAEKIYFTGEKPPKLVRIKGVKGDITPPSFTHVYVPEGSEKIYRKWYKKYGVYDSLNGFDTFKSEDKI